MEWISVKERLPKDGEVVLIKLKYVHPYLCVARYMDNLSTFDRDFDECFVLMRLHPRFPEVWLSTEEYKKMSPVPLKKVEYWISIPELP